MLTSSSLSRRSPVSRRSHIISLENFQRSNEELSVRFFCQVCLGHLTTNYFFRWLFFQSIEQVAFYELSYGSFSVRRYSICMAITEREQWNRANHYLLNILCVFFLLQTVLTAPFPSNTPFFLELWLAQNCRAATPMKELKAMIITNNS